MEFINFGIIADLYTGSVIGIFFGAFLFLDMIIYFPFFAPYFDLCCFRAVTPCVSRFPLKI